MDGQVLYRITLKMTHMSIQNYFEYEFDEEVPVEINIMEHIKDIMKAFSELYQSVSLVKIRVVKYIE